MQPGDVVAERFELKSLPAAHGGTAAIFRAFDRETGATVALKVSYGRQARDARRFAREAEYLARFDHLSIVGYIAHGTAQGVAYIALEWLSGESLEKRLARVGLTLEETVAMAGQVASALEHAHAHGVMHRDIQPGNLFLVDGKPERVKVLGFGVAGDVDGRGTWDQMSGAPMYMSPEQLGGAVIDWRSDIFSLGCVLYECVSGRRAFAGDTLMEIVSQVMLSEAEPLPALPPAVRSQLEPLVSQMLAKEPLDRPKAGRIARDLEALRRTLEPEPARPAQQAAPRMGEERRLVCVAVAHAPAQPSPLDKSTAKLVDMHSNEMAIATDLARSFGASVAHVPGMGLLVVPDARFLVTDQLALVARCALALSAALPEMGVGLAARREVVKGGGWPFGEAVSVASELAERAEREVLVDPSVAELLGRRFRVTETGRGKVLLAYDPSAEVTTVGRDARFVGRAPEVRMLADKLERVVAQRQPVATLLTGPAGVGKSRLLREVLRALVGDGVGMHLLVGRGDPIGAGSPFAMAAQALYNAIEAGPNDSPSRLYAALERRLATIGLREHASKVVAYLGALLGLPPAQHAAELAWALRDAALMADGIRWAFSEWLRHEASGQQLLVLVIEDLHWGDYPTVRLVLGALNTLTDVPLMVFALGRPEVEERFGELARASERIELGGLAPEQAQELAGDLLGTRATPALVQRLVQRGGGNPLYMRELAALPHHRDESLPETVLSTAEANIERLAPPARRLLRAASVFGEVFWPSGIVVLLGQWHAEEVSTWLPWLEGEGIIERRAGAELEGEPGYAFHAQLLRDVAYAMLSDADRAASHRLAAEWLEQHREADALILAEQWMRGGAPSRAVEHFRRAAEKAMAGHDFRGTIDYAERAVRCGPRGELLGGLHLLIATAHDWDTDNAACAAAAEAALAHLKHGSGSWFTAFVLAIISRLRLAGAEGVTDLCDQLEAVAGAMIATEEEVIALARTSGYLTMYGDLDQGWSFFRRAEHRAQQFERQSPLLRGWLSWARAWQAQAAGDLALTLGHDTASMLAFDEAGDLRNLCYARSNVGYAQMRLGLFEEAESSLSLALDTAQRLGLRTIASGAAHNLGLVQGLLHHHAVAVETELAAIALFSSLRSGRGETMATEYLARIHLMRGDLAAAEDAARRARSMAGDWPSLVAICSASLARVLVARGAFEEAQRAAEHGVELFEVHGSADGEEHFIMSAMAETLLRLGRVEEARAVLRDACDTLHAAAARIADDRLRWAFLHNVPEHRSLLELSRTLVPDERSS